MMVQDEIEIASHDFHRLVLPRIQKDNIIPGIIESICVEGIQSPLNWCLDAIAGIDVMLIIERPPPLKSVAVGLASRIQYGVNYQTWTVRMCRFGVDGVSWNTELQKRAQQIKDGAAIRPTWNCHAYIDARGGRLLSLAVARTDDFFGSIYQGIVQWLKGAPWAIRKIETLRSGSQLKCPLGIIRRTKNAAFLVVDWDPQRHYAENYVL
tara:strand:+ start:785 stop:1411 length:627 start_codon:yes stop_codon:yes gene_type:complete